MPDPSRVRVHGPLEPFAQGFAGELARQGYVPRVVVHQLRLVADVSRWLAEQELQVSDFPDEAARFLHARRAAGFTRHWTSRALRPVLTYLGRLSVVPPTPPPVLTNAVDVLLARYRAVSHQRAGVGRADSARVSRRYSPVSGGATVAGRSPCGYRAPVGRRRDGVCRGSRADAIGARGEEDRLLRSDPPQFLHLEGAISTPLVAAVPSVAAWRLAGLPKLLDASDVQRLLASCDRRTPPGLRDFAILTTLARVGFRAGEVAALQLDDLDWRRGEIVVHGKGPRSSDCRSPRTSGRPSPRTPAWPSLDGTGPAVFVRRMAPHRGPYTRGPHPDRRRGRASRRPRTIHAHRLRHSAATADAAGRSARWPRSVSSCATALR